MCNLSQPKIFISHILLVSSNTNTFESFVYSYDRMRLLDMCQTSLTNFFWWICVSISHAPFILSKGLAAGISSLHVIYDSIMTLHILLSGAAHFLVWQLRLYLPWAMFNMPLRTNQCHEMYYTVKAKACYTNARERKLPIIHPVMQDDWSQNLVTTNDPSICSPR